MKELKTRQIGLLFLAFLPVTKIFTLPATLSLYAKEDLLLSAVLPLALDCIVLWAVWYASTRADCDFPQLIHRSLGNIGAKIYFLFFCVYFFLKAYLPIIEQKDYVEQTLYETDPTFLIFFPFFIISAYLSVKPLRTLGRAADLLASVTALSFFLIFFLSLEQTDFSALLPIGAQGSKILTASYYTLSWFGDGAYFLFLFGTFKKEKRGLIKLFGGYLGAALFTLVFFAMFYASFTAIADRQDYALNEMAKYSAVIMAVGRFDFIAIFLLLGVGVFSISLPLYFSTYALRQVLPLRQSPLAAIIVNGAMLVFILLTRHCYVTVRELYIKWFGISVLFFSYLLPLVTAAFRKKESLPLKERTQ